MKNLVIRLIHAILILIAIIVLSELLFNIFGITLVPFMPDFSEISFYLNRGHIYIYISFFISYLIAPKLIKV